MRRVLNVYDLWRCLYSLRNEKSFKSALIYDGVCQVCHHCLTDSMCKSKYVKIQLWLTSFQASQDDDDHDDDQDDDHVMRIVNT